MIGVLQIVDTLHAGGMERMAVNIANRLPRDRFSSHLCTTRDEGPLAETVLPHVGRLSLRRRHRFDWRALRRLGRHLRENRIQIVHAHGTAMFFALLTRHPVVLWHDHFGRFITEKRSVKTYRLAARRLAGVIAVNDPLAGWSRSELGIDRVWYIPNFVCETNGSTAGDLPGERGARVVCVANFRPEKDHATLLSAMRIVARHNPKAHLLLLGNGSDPGELPPNVTWLGSRSDVPAVLKACDVGVLSSRSEGMPLALLEYGATDCRPSPRASDNVPRCSTMAAPVCLCRRLRPNRWRKRSSPCCNRPNNGPN